MAERRKLTLTLTREKEDGTTEELVKQDLSHVAILGEVWGEPTKMMELICQTGVREIGLELTQSQKLLDACKLATILSSIGTTRGRVVHVEEFDNDDPEDKLADQINGGNEDA